MGASGAAVAHPTRPHIQRYVFRKKEIVTGNVLTAMEVKDGHHFAWVEYTV